MKHITIKYFLIAVLLCVFNPLKAQNKPNVLFLAIDDLNDFASCMNGAISVPTPNIDKLAKEGILFTNAHCQAPICGPSRASVMTGLYPSTSGNYLQLRDVNIKKSNEASEKAIFLPDYFEQYGYKTMAVGKMFHNGDKSKAFQEYGGYLNEMSGLRPPEPMSYKPKGQSKRTLSDWGPYFDHDSLTGGYKIAKWATNKLSEKHNTPFFLGVGFLKPHAPWHVPQKWFDKFPIDKIKTPPYKKDDFDDIPLMAQKVSELPSHPSAEELIALKQWKALVQAYSATVSFVDAQIGKVLDALERSEYAKNTIVVLWSDHGYHVGEKNRVGKHSLWERATRTVLIFKDLNKNIGKTCNATVGLIDMYPTLLDMCHLPKNEHLEGRSLTDLFKEPNKLWDYPALCFYGKNNVTVRGKRFKLIQYEDGSLELYDLQKDPNEWDNLASLKEHKKTVKNLQTHIPTTWAPLSKYSGYNVNAYFRKVSGWK